MAPPRGGKSWVPKELDCGALKLGRTLGQGTCGTVYEGAFMGGGERVRAAVKGVNLPLDRLDAREFELLADTIRRYREKSMHSRVVRCYGVSVHASQMVVVTELCLGGDLRRRLWETNTHTTSSSSSSSSASPRPRSRGPSGPTRVDISSRWRVAAQIAEGLQHLHAEPPVVHGDLKPEHVMFDDSDNVKISFELVLPAAMTEAHDPVDSHTGTVNYMAPECFSTAADGGNLVTPKTDVWALGCVFLSLFSGEVPFGAMDSWRILRRLRDGQGPPMPESVPAGMRGILEACLRVDPADRPTAADIVKRIQSAADCHGG
eukprot:GHVU01022395.1.p1 GENE.GHVU01022395.1~~GHVU01022395.1.p1  ORF type:complete len:318 (+),score=48.41 GHVU01022395.1:204-1157(+)